MLFTTAANLIATLTKAHAEGRLDEKLKLYTTPRLLIIDEIGYLPIDRLGANLFFQLISRRYERGPMILTSNQSFGAWGEVFGDRVIATAILDRLLHHAVTLNIRGNSYRLKEKLKAGLVRAEEARSTEPGGEFSIPITGEIWMPLTPAPGRLPARSPCRPCSGHPSGVRCTAPRAKTVLRRRPRMSRNLRVAESLPSQGREPISLLGSDLVVAHGTFPFLGPN